MSWFIAIAVCGALALAALLSLTAKRHDAGTVTGRFNFDGYKENELSQRGILEKTR